ncbi:MAG: hypothetical protein WCG09_07825 [Halobacteriota archaeon]|jgi:hypothetical protein
MPELRDSVKDLDLIIPVYLDVEALLDVFASLEGGFTAATSEVVRDAVSESKERSFGAEFGARALTFLRLGGEAEVKGAKKKEKEQEVFLERYNTYGSLFYTLRSRLYQEGLIERSHSNINNLAELKTSDFVELRGIFRPDPLIELITKFQGLMDVLTPAMKRDVKDKTKGSSKRPQRPKPQQNAAAEIAGLNMIGEFFESTEENMEKGGTRTFLVDLDDGSGYNVVTPLLKHYARDSTMTQLAYRDFRLLGKVLNNVQDGGIDLWKGTALSALSDELVDGLLVAFGQVQQSGFKFGSVQRYVEAPALEVLPIAVYI